MRALAARSFAAQSPEWTVQVVDAEPLQARELLAAGEVDAAVVYEFEPGGPGLWPTTAGGAPS